MARQIVQMNRRRLVVLLVAAVILAPLIVKFTFPICTLRKMTLWVNVVLHHDEAFVAVAEQYCGQRRSPASMSARSFIGAVDDNIGEDFTLWHLRKGKLQSFTIKHLATCSPFIVNDTLYCGGRFHGDNYVPQTWKWTGQKLEMLSPAESKKITAITSPRPDSGFFPKSEWHLKSELDLLGEDSDKRMIVTPFDAGQEKYALVLERSVRGDGVAHWERLTLRFVSPKQNDHVIYLSNSEIRQAPCAEYEAAKDDLYHL